MVQKPVISLERLSMMALSDLVYFFSSRVATLAMKLFPSEEEQTDQIHIHTDQETLYPALSTKMCKDTGVRHHAYGQDRDMFLTETVAMFKEYVMSSVVWYLEEDVCQAVLQGLDRATRDKKSRWTRTTDIRGFTHQLYGIVQFAEIIVTPTRKALRLDQCPQILRTKLYCCLSEMRQLKVLVLGSGSGGWGEVFEDKFILGVSQLKHLCHFSLKYDCTKPILKVLSETCSGSLIVLDVEHSNMVKDNCVDIITSCSNLRELNIFHTGLTTGGQANVIKGLPKLEVLHRGDFLCDVLEHIEWEDPEYFKSMRLKLTAFWASEKYFFHSSDQMSLVASTCPNINKMLFMFNSSASTFHDLTVFAYLKELDIWGGDFYLDDLYVALEDMGPRLTKLNLVHIEELDKRAVCLVSSSCPHLTTLGFYNCGFLEPSRVSEEEAFAAADRRAERELVMHHMLDVASLNVTSEIGEEQLVTIISSCLNVKQLNLGMNTAISDNALARILSANAMQHLDSLQITQCKEVTLKGVSMLISTCPQLTACFPLDSWEGITMEQLSQFQHHLAVNNVMLRTQDEDVGDQDEVRDSVLDSPDMASLDLIIDTSLDF